VATHRPTDASTRLARAFTRLRLASRRPARAALAAVFALAALQPALPALAAAPATVSAGAAGATGAVTVSVEPAATGALVTGLRPSALDIASTSLPGAGVIDYAGGYRSTTPARLKKAGIGIVIRYVGASAWKSLTLKEANALRKEGIDIAAVYETTADWMFAGRAAGVAAAKKARSAIIKCGGPKKPFIYFACDRETTRYAAVNACLSGAASVIGTENVGIYGSYNVCKSALDGHYAAKAWQTLAWSYGKVLPEAALYQSTRQVFSNTGLDYDTNFARDDAMGQWAYAGPGTLGWAQQDADADEDFCAVDFAGAATGIAVGAEGTVRATADAGRTWVARSPGVDADLNAVDLVTTNTGWAVGGGGTVLRTTDAGSTWTSQTAPTSKTLRAVRFADAVNGWAVGDGGTLIHTASAGATWTAQASTSTADLLGVDFASGATGWAVGERGAILRTTDAGATWTAQSTSTTKTLTAVDFVSPSIGWAVGERGTILRTLSAGAVWKPVSSVPTSVTLTAVRFVDDKCGWVAGESGTVLQTTDGGLHWTQRYVSTSANLRTVTFAGPTSGWVAGDDGTMVHATITGATRFATASGRVLDVDTGLGVPGVTVWVGDKVAAPTDVDGRFVAARVKPGTYAVKFTHPLWVTKSTPAAYMAASMRTIYDAQLKARIPTALSKPSILPTAPTPAAPTTFSVTITPAEAANAAVTTLQGYHWESKRVRKRVHGHYKYVRVWYWRSRRVLPMTAETPGHLTVASKLGAGKWRVQAKYPGTSKRLSASSAKFWFWVK